MVADNARSYRAYMGFLSLLLVGNQPHRLLSSSQAEVGVTVASDNAEAKYTALKTSCFECYVKEPYTESKAICIIRGVC